MHLECVCHIFSNIIHWKKIDNRVNLCFQHWHLIVIKCAYSSKVLWWSGLLSVIWAVSLLLWIVLSKIFLSLKWSLNLFYFWCTIQKHFNGLHFRMHIFYKQDFLFSSTESCFCSQREWSRNFQDEVARGLFHRHLLVFHINIINVSPECFRWDILA